MQDQILFRTKHRGLMLILGIIMAASSVGLQLSMELGVFNVKHKTELLRRFGVRKQNRNGRRRKEGPCYE